MPTTPRTTLPSTRCPSCGRRHIARHPATAAAPLPLFAWAARRPTAPARPIRLTPAPRVILFPDTLNPDGLPRAGLLHPGHRFPVIYASLPAALAALNVAGLVA